MIAWTTASQVLSENGSKNWVCKQFYIFQNKSINRWGYCALQAFKKKDYKYLASQFILEEKLKNLDSMFKSRGHLFITKKS